MVVEFFSFEIGETDAFSVFDCFIERWRNERGFFLFMVLRGSSVLDWK